MEVPPFADSLGAEGAETGVNLRRGDNITPSQMHQLQQVLAADGLTTEVFPQSHSDPYQLQPSSLQETVEPWIHVL